MPSSPTMPGRTTNSASPEKICSSALTTSTWIVEAIFVLLERLGFLERFLDRSYHVERLLVQRVALAVDDHCKALDRLLQRHELARRSRENLSDAERLREEALDLAGSRDGELVLGRQLVHTENRDDVAQLLVALQHRLNAARRLVVLLADHVRIHLARR